MTMTQPEFDLIIAGAGLVGGTLACALADAGLRVALVDPKAVPRPSALTPRPDQRVFAITRASERIFVNSGIWRHMTAERLSPFREMEVWDAGGQIHFDSADLGEPLLGHILELQVMQAALLTRLAELDNVHWFAGRAISAFEADEHRINVALDNEQVLSARLLAGADGAASRVRALAGIDCREQDYGHHALVATVETEQPHRETAWQHFLPEGPLAFLPLAEPHTCSIVWSTAPEQAETLMQLDEADFNRELGEAFGAKLGAIRHTAGRGRFPLRRRHAEHYVQSRLALLGDAAHTIHPLAGQGVNLGLLDAALLAEVCIAARDKHRDPGGLHTLRRYERGRRGGNQSMMWLMDGFKSLFGNRQPALSWLRNTGLNLADAVPAAKQLMMRQAMGLSGDLPDLARPR